MAVRNDPHREMKSMKHQLMKYQDPELIFTCEICALKFKSTSSLQRHHETAHGDSCYICPSCGKISKDRSAFVSHQSSKHGLTYTTAKRLSDPSWLATEACKFHVPPQPVLSLTREETIAWFPGFLDKLVQEVEADWQAGREERMRWMADIEEVISLKQLAEQGKAMFGDKELGWKVKLVSAIVLLHKGVDFTTFGIRVARRFNKYTSSELKMMSEAKNPATFEKMFETLPHEDLGMGLITTKYKKMAKFECQICNFKTHREKIIRKHKEKKHMGKLLSCAFCIFQAVELDVLQRHREKVHIPQVCID